MENPKYRLTICFADNETQDVFADNVLFYDSYMHISRSDSCVMIVPISNIKFILSKRLKFK